MSRSKEIDEQIEALTRQKKRYMEEAALAKEYRDRQRRGVTRTDDRELPLVSSYEECI